MAMIDRNFTFATNGTVSAADLHNLIDSATIYQDLITGQLPITSVGTNYELLIADVTNPNAAPNAVTVYDLFEDALTAGTYSNANISAALTYGTATGTRLVSTNATITTGTITTGVIPSLTAGTTTSTAATITSGTITNLASTTGTIATLNSTTGTIATLNSTTGTIPTLVATTLITTGTGTAAAPAIVPTGDTNTGLFFPAADTIAFAEGGAEAMRIDSSGLVGIGTTSPDALLDVKRVNTDGLIAEFGSGDLAGDVVLEIKSSDSRASINIGANGGTGDASRNLAFSTNGTERLRIDGSGNVGIGTTSPQKELQINATEPTIRLEENGAGSKRLELSVNSAAEAKIFANQSGGVLILGTVGTERLRIDSSGGLILAGSTAQKASGTTWSNPSDVRIKKNIRDYEKGLDSLMQVRVREWEYNGKAGTVNDSKNTGVIADEIENVLPDTVSTYNAKLNEGDENDSQIKKFDASEVTWLLVKSLQELKAENDSLKSRIEALEAK